MKFLIDENVDIHICKALRKEGYDTKDIKELKLYSLSDKEILNLANKEERILITYDTDFERNSSLKSIKHCGIILLRFRNQSTKKVLDVLLSTLKSKTAKKFPNNFVIISEIEIIVNRIKNKLW